MFLKYRAKAGFFFILNFWIDIIRRFLKYYALYFTYRVNEDLYQSQSLVVRAEF
jgi:hypothetical protein